MKIYASKSNDGRTCKILKVLFLTESEIIIVAKELKRTSHQSRFTLELFLARSA